MEVEIKKTKNVKIKSPNYNDQDLPPPHVTFEGLEDRDEDLELSLKQKLYNDMWNHGIIQIIPDLVERKYRSKMAKVNIFSTLFCQGIGLIDSPKNARRMLLAMYSKERNKYWFLKDNSWLDFCKGQILSKYINYYTGFLMEKKIKNLKLEYINTRTINIVKSVFDIWPIGSVVRSRYSRKYRKIWFTKRYGELLRWEKSTDEWVFGNHLEHIVYFYYVPINGKMVDITSYITTETFDVVDGNLVKIYDHIKSLENIKF